VDGKGDALAAQIAALNTGAPTADTFTLDPAAFGQIPGSPFAYWVGDAVSGLFVQLEALSDHFDVRQGLVTADDFRFLRGWWEAPARTQTPGDSKIERERRWYPYAKGGAHSPFYRDLVLVVDWGNDGERIRTFRTPSGRVASRPQNLEFFFRPGLTWPRRPHRKVSFRALPAGCVFSENGPALFLPEEYSFVVLAVLNSSVIRLLASLLMSRGSEGSGQTQTYEIGVVQRLPFPPLIDDSTRGTLAALALEAHDLQRDRDRTDETTHAFGVPGLALHRAAPTLQAAGDALAAEESTRRARLAAIQAEIDETVLRLYGLTIEDLRLTIGEGSGQRAVGGEQWAEGSGQSAGGGELDAEGDEDEPEIVNAQDSGRAPLPSALCRLPSSAADLLMWCVGVAFGRWDVRKALDPSLLPPLGGPFDPLPRYAPGYLRLGIDDLRLEDDPQSSIVNQQSSIAPHGILVDDPAHRWDIVARVRGVLELLYGERAEAIEREACAILEVATLRDYFRDPRRFYAHHIKRYSKSRRKAPIYWLLQSDRRNYGLWYSYHRLDHQSLFRLWVDYADPKLRLEQERLADLSAHSATLEGSARRAREREVERQEKLIGELTAFHKTLHAVALLQMRPDLNDGVLLSIAPLWELTPWSEARRAWEALKAGQYPWSTISQEMARKGLVKK
jgi:hypothetical protein